ncbi:hypothetical protein OLVG_00192 [Ostreococcus lucimarinus virus OlV6]|jgi:hypothetical protein|uniref:hypothetical protein n=1 Tax=Ostreococcus lucimarinus virus OlV5 TaxID=754064 RepID=UPI00026335D7|nr:hypothetical protein OLNG_00198 [Ostreococcus lucimarinus virus OlV5]AFK65946.1 hypothetical protein OLVG_00192 [Ostreococcus lucimarinus virus OlV6]AGH31268.1 hypothetical protein OLNG_00198 [Ostreococcus lucimarinus virus OlV5]
MNIYYMNMGRTEIIIDEEIKAIELDIASAQGSLKVFNILKNHGVETIKLQTKNDNSQTEISPEEIVRKMEQVAENMGGQVITHRQDS